MRMLIGIVSLLILAACGAPSTPPEPTPAHCGNGIRDNNEERPDCGGPCLACEPELPCVDNSGTFFFEELPAGTVTAVYCEPDSGIWQVVGDFGTLVMWFDSTEQPMARGRYELGRCGFPEPGYVCARLRHKAFPGLFLYADGGNLGVTEENGELRFRFCNVFFASNASSVGTFVSGAFRCE